MSLPTAFVKRWAEKAKGATYFGVPLEELSREELIACCACSWKREEDERNEHLQNLEFIRSLIKTEGIK